MNEVATHRNVGVAPVAGHIGAEVTGVDLGGELTGETVTELRSALLEHRVLFFRGQHLDHGGLVALGERLGSLTRRPGEQHGPSPEGFPEILVVDAQVEDSRYGRDFEERYRRRWSTYTAGWHSDLTPLVNPPAISILAAERVTSCGGDTQWTNLVAAYEGLSGPVRDLAEGLSVEHCFFAGCTLVRHDPDDAAVLARDDRTGNVAIHPVVAVHPETGERVLYVNPASTSRVAGLTPTESRTVLELLFEQTVRPEYTVRHRWSDGDVVMWDNRATSHLGATDLGRSTERRTMHRVTVWGDRLVGVDGRRSELVKGEPLVALEGHR